MKVFRWKGLAVFCAIALALGFTLSSPQVVSGQETTGGMQGTVKDPSGAVVPGASVTVTTPTLVGSKVVDTDASGYYRLANLPPGNYTILVKAQGFDTLKRENVNLEVGHLPTINLTLSVGAVNTVVEVKTEGPMIDETTTTTLTNIPEETAPRHSARHVFPIGHSVCSGSPQRAPRRQQHAEQRQRFELAGQRIATAALLDSRSAAAPTRRTPTWSKARKRPTSSAATRTPTFRWTSSRKCR